MSYVPPHLRNKSDQTRPQEVGGRWGDRPQETRGFRPNYGRNYGDRGGGGGGYDRSRRPLNRVEEELERRKHEEAIRKEEQRIATNEAWENRRKEKIRKAQLEKERKKKVVELAAQRNKEYQEMIAKHGLIKPKEKPSTGGAPKKNDSRVVLMEDQMKQLGIEDLSDEEKSENNQ